MVERNGRIVNILFDLDGTLVDSLAGIEHSVMAALATVVPNYSLTTSNIRALIGPPVRQVFRELLQTVDDATLDRLEGAFRQLYDNGGWQKSLAFADVASTLVELKRRGLRRFVVTNKPALPTHNILSYLGLADYFEAIISPNSQTPPFANKSAAVAHLLASYNLASTETLMVGDSKDDAQAAASNELGFVAATYGFGNLEAATMSPHYYCVTAFAQLLDII